MRRTSKKLKKAVKFTEEDLVLQAAMEDSGATLEPGERLPTDAISEAFPHVIRELIKKREDTKGKKFRVLETETSSGGDGEAKFPSKVENTTVYVVSPREFVEYLEDYLDGSMTNYRKVARNKKLLTYAGTDGLANTLKKLNKDPEEIRVECNGTEFGESVIEFAYDKTDYEEYDSEGDLDITTWGSDTELLPSSPWKVRVKTTIKLEGEFVFPGSYIHDKYYA